MHFTSEVKRSCIEMYFDLGLIFLHWTLWVSPYTTEIPTIIIMVRMMIVYM